MKNFFIRAGSALVVAILVIAGILYSRFTFFPICLIIVLGSVHEFYKITRKSSVEGENAEINYPRFALWMAGILYTFSFYLWGGFNGIITAGDSTFSIVCSKLLEKQYPSTDMYIFLPVCLFSFFILELYSKSKKPFENIGWNVTALIYITMPVLLLNRIYFEKGALTTLGILFLIWFFDSFCYIWGSLLGKHKLMERISPKKTWEGFIGGFISTLILSYFYPAIFNWLISLHADFRLQIQEYSSFQWVFMAAIIVIFATWGDLVESLLKRSLGVKDSGSIMPGHGGFLDRLDAILIAIPFATLALWLADQYTILKLIANFLG